MSKPDFTPAPKRFMVWSVKDSKFVPVPYDESRTVFDLQDIAEFLAEPQDSTHLVCQSTNLFDPSGKEIFEGSIVQIQDDWDTYGMNAGEVYVVYQNAGGWRLKPKYTPAIPSGARGIWLEDGADVNLLGHVFTNPELIERTK